jgi:hypothetical protein
MFNMMEAFVAKRLGIPPKIVESEVSELAEAQELLWNAVPLKRGENLKAWYERAARDLKWTPRRVRAYWNGEARTIHHREIKTLTQRISSAKAAENRHQEEANAIRQSMETGSESSALDGRPPQRLRD